MSEVQIGPGDAVSRLLQAQAKDLDIKRVWTGRAIEDVRRVLVDLYNAQLLKTAAWNAIQELYAMPELKDLPEPVQVKLMSVILATKAVAELQTKTP